jgi:hypothetical protein
MSYVYFGDTPPIQQPVTDPDSGPQDIINHRNFDQNKNRQTPYVPYTPVVSNTSGGFTYGTGAFQVGRYKKVGSQVVFYFQIAFGNPGFVSGGATNWEISLPIPYVIPPLPVPFTQIPLGHVWLRRGTGQLQDMGAAVSGASANSFGVLPGGINSGLRLNGTSVVWAQNAMLEGVLVYETKP